MPPLLSPFPSLVFFCSVLSYKKNILFFIYHLKKTLLYFLVLPILCNKN